MDKIIRSTALEVWTTAYELPPPRHTHPIGKMNEDCDAPKKHEDDSEKDGPYTCDVGIAP